MVHGASDGGCHKLLVASVAEASFPNGLSEAAEDPVALTLGEVIQEGVSFETDAMEVLEPALPGSGLVSGCTFGDGVSGGGCDSSAISQELISRGSGDN